MKTITKLVSLFIWMAERKEKWCGVSLLVLIGASFPLFAIEYHYNILWVGESILCSYVFIMLGVLLAEAYNKRRCGNGDH